MELKEAKFGCFAHDEAEYVAASACCAQLLWMKQTLSDCGYEFSKFHSCVTMRVPSS
jgi:hypothetical protein